MCYIRKIVHCFVCGTKLALVQRATNTLNKYKKTYMKKILLTLTVAALATWQAAAANWAAGLGATDYNGDSTPDISGITLTLSGTAPWVPSTLFSGYSALTPGGIEYGAGYDSWFPLGYANFVAKIWATISVPADGNYGFGTFSDDGSALYVDGNLVVNNGGEHAPYAAFSTTFLTAGTHSLLVEYYEGDPLYQANLTAYVGPGVSTPDGGTTLSLLGLGFAGLASLRRRL